MPVILKDLRLKNYSERLGKIGDERYSLVLTIGGGELGWLSESRLFCGSAM
jgi:hypothetical protein